MLVNLTPIQSEIERCKKIAEEINYKYIPQSDPQWIKETGIYQCAFAFNFRNNEFEETKNLSWESKYPVLRNHEVSSYGVADNIEQIKEYYKEEIEDKENKYFIHLTPVFQDKENAGKGGGWRWHKWGVYIGNLNHQCEYLDDEDFGDDFKHVIVFSICKL